MALVRALFLTKKSPRRRLRVCHKRVAEQSKDLDRAMKAVDRNRSISTTAKARNVAMVLALASAGIPGTVRGFAQIQSSSNPSRLDASVQKPFFPKNDKRHIVFSIGILGRRSRRPNVRLEMSSTVTDEVATGSVPTASGTNSSIDTAFDVGVEDTEVASSVALEDYDIQKKTSTGAFASAWALIEEKIGKVDESRLLFPEYNSGEVPRMFSSLEYETCSEGKVESVNHAAGSVLGAAALVAGTTVGAGVLALPSATAAAGFLPSSAAMLAAWAYMTMSGLFIAELTLNRMAITGRPGLGLLDLYGSSLGKPWSIVGSGAYFFLHYAMLVAYIAQGGANLESVLPGTPLFDGMGQVGFVTACATALYVFRASLVEQVNNILVFGVVATFLGILAIGSGTADFASLIDTANQHPEQVVDCFPILFLAFVYQNIVPTVVTQLEGDRGKIVKSIIAGTTTPLLMFLAWNAVVLGNVAGADLANTDPVALIQSGQLAGNAALSQLVTAFSSLAIVTSIIGFTYGLVDAWTDVFKISTSNKNEYEKWKLPLFALVFLPPLALSLTDPDIFYKSLEYGGAFGVSTLFLVLPPIMVWKERYGEDQTTPLATKPMVPLGKIPIGSMWKAAATLIVEQGAEKLGIIDYLEKTFFT